MVRIKSSYAVKPNEPTPIVKLWLTELDQLMAYGYVPTIFVYTPEVSTSAEASSVLHTLTDSLSRALVAYYPFAGRMSCADGSRFELDCNAKGVSFIEAESEARLADYGDFSPNSETSKLAPRVDYSDDISELPLLLAQLTRFKCGGITIGITIARILADGKGFFGFITSWANIARGDKEIVQPYHDRTVFYKGDPAAKPRFDHVELKASPVLIGSSDAEELMKTTTTRVLKLSKQQVDMLKEKANEGRGKDDREHTRYEAMAGHIWRCASKARGLLNEQVTSLRSTVDIRNRVRPPLPSGYYGSATMITTARAESGKLLSSPLGLGFACSLVRKSIDKVNDDYIRSATEFLISQPELTRNRPGVHSVGSSKVLFQGNPNVSVTSWAQLPIDDADFGWGVPMFMGHAASASDGKAFIISGRDEDESGSLSVMMCLQVAHMDNFEKFFYKDKVPTPLSRY